VITTEDARLAARQLGNETDEVERLSGGRSRDVFRLGLKARDVVLKIGELASGEGLLLEARLLRYLRRNTAVDTPSSEILSTGEPIDIVTVRRRDYAAVVMSFEPGSRPSLPEHFQQLGRALGLLHGHGPVRFVPTRPILDPSRLSPERLPPALREALDIGQLEETLKIVARRNAEIGKVICHGDIPDNAFVSPHGIRLFDFEHAALDDPLADLASATYHAVTADRPALCAQAVRRGYDSLDFGQRTDESQLFGLTGLIGLRIARWRVENWSRAEGSLSQNWWREPLEVTNACWGRARSFGARLDVDP
jgi:Ser/Thr protein kinase RdoA (MazF antagonist)